MSKETKIDISIYEGIVSDIDENSESLKVNVNEILEGKEKINGTWTMESYFCGESQLALELTEYSKHVSSKMVPLLTKTRDDFLSIDEDGEASITTSDQ